MDYDSLYFVIIISLIIFILSATGIAVFVSYLILKKFNNFGETPCSIFQYSKEGINYTRIRDYVLPDDRNDLFLYYGENPYPEKTGIVHEQLLKNSENCEE